MNLVSCLHTILVVFALSGQPSPSPADSLRALLPGGRDSTTVNVLNELAQQLVATDQRAAYHYAEQALELADSIRYPYGQAEAHRLLGFFSNIEEAVLREGGSYRNAFKHLSIALEKFQEMQNLQGQAMTLANLGKLHYDHGQYDRSYENFLLAIQIFDSLSQLPELADTYNRTGHIFYQQQNFEEARNHYQKGLEIQESIDDLYGMAQSLNNLGSVMYEMDLLDEGLAYHQQSLELKLANNDLLGASISYNNIGDIYEEKGDYDEAITYQTKALELAVQIGNMINHIYTCNRLARVHMKKGEYEIAEKHLLDSDVLVSASDYMRLRMDTYWLLHQVYDAKQQYAPSLKFFKAFATLKDSVFSQQKNNQIADLRIKYETEKSKIENDLLKERESLLELQVHNQFNTNVVIVIALILALGLIVALLRINKIRDRANKSLSHAITDLRRTQSQLVHSEKMASLGQVTAGVAHEINNPLNFISSGTFLMERNLKDLEKLAKAYAAIDLGNGGISKEQLKELQSLHDELGLEEMMKEMQMMSTGVNEGIERISEIVKSLKLFSKGGVAELGEVNLHDQIDTSLVVLGSRIRGHITIVKNYDRALDKAPGYPGQMSQVFVNVLNNAIDAIGDHDGIINITTRAEESNVKVHIKDNGPGMREDVVRKIFDPFFSTKEVGNGAGLGLSISFGIVQRHKGNIEVNSEIGEGTELIITLPLSQGKKKSANQSAKRGESINET